MIEIIYSKIYVLRNIVSKEASAEKSVALNADGTESFSTSPVVSDGQAKQVAPTVLSAIVSPTLDTGSDSSESKG